MKNNTYKILVLSDLTEQTNYALNHAVNLAKTIEADIEFFHVKPLIEVVGTNSQLSAMRKLSSEYVATDKRMIALMSSISETHDAKINRSFTFGHVKSEIEKFIISYAPDVIVLGSKKRKKKLNFMGDNITNFVIKKHKGPVVIASKESAFDFDKEFLPDLLKNERVVIEA
jgi:nucleotide-binding universal stress UspA family protein